MGPAYKIDEMVKDKGGGKYLIRRNQWDCFDIPDPGNPRIISVGGLGPDDFGLVSFVTLHKIELGCCPPWLMSKMQGFMEFGW